MLLSLICWHRVMREVKYSNWSGFTKCFQKWITCFIILRMRTKMLVSCFNLSTTIALYQWQRKRSEPSIESVQNKQECNSWSIFFKDSKMIITRRWMMSMSNLKLDWLCKGLLRLKLERIWNKLFWSKFHRDMLICMISSKLNSKDIFYSTSQA